VAGKDDNDKPEEQNRLVTFWFPCLSMAGLHLETSGPGAVLVGQRAIWPPQPPPSFTFQILLCSTVPGWGGILAGKLLSCTPREGGVSLIDNKR
jgi:hypothetical protein